MKTWCFFNPATGLFIDRIYCSSNLQSLEANTPEGLYAVEGRYDYLSQRVDVESGEVIDYQPPQPSDDHEWNVNTKRWQLKQEVEARNRQRASALMQLQQLDAKETRAISDLLTHPNDETAQTRLAAVRAQKDELRKQL